MKDVAAANTALVSLSTSGISPDTRMRKIFTQVETKYRRYEKMGTMRFLGNFTLLFPEMLLSPKTSSWRLSRSSDWNFPVVCSGMTDSTFWIA
jgi:hypothetical protein